jgi:hypothetical protein
MMKIRQGFVSNSSSSSFVIFAHKATIDDIKDDDVMMYSWDEYGEGNPYWRPTNEQIEWALKNKDKIGRGVSLFREFASFCEEGDAELSGQEFVDKLAKLALDTESKVVVKMFEKSYHYPESLEDFQDVFMGKS